MPSRATREVENLPTANARQQDDLLYLVVRDREYGLRE